MVRFLRLLFIASCLCCLFKTASAGQITELAGQASVKSYDEAQRLIKDYSQQLQNNPSDTKLMVKLGNLYFMLKEFDLAVENYSSAIKIDNRIDAAYFGRGMALGRSGYIHDGIKDLTVYIKRHPMSSLAYTKRGVRHLWLDEESEAKKDFQKAIELDPKNAEANDDLGVIYAKRKQYTEAIKHFSTTVRLDPTYQKGYHNLAMAYYLVGQDDIALESVNSALSLNARDRSSALLKVEILKALGRTQEAEALKDDAEFLPEGNWSESISVQ